MRTVHILLVTTALLVPGTVHAQVLYGAVGSDNTASDLYIVNPANGDTTAIGPIGFSVTGMSTDPLSGDLYGVTAGGSAAVRQLILIDATTGAGTVIGPLGTRVSDITFSSSGILYGWSEPSDDDLVTINTATGAATIVGNSGLGTSGSGLDFSPGGVLYFAGSSATGVLRTINPVTGAPTDGPTMNGSGNVSALAFHPFTGVLYAIAGSDLVTIDTLSGNVTTIGPLPDDFDALAWSEAAAVPAMPMSMLLVLAVLTAAVASVLLRGRARMA